MDLHFLLRLHFHISGKRIYLNVETSTAINGVASRVKGSHAPK